MRMKLDADEFAQRRAGVRHRARALDGIKEFVIRTDAEQMKHRRRLRLASSQSLSPP